MISNIPDLEILLPVHNEAGSIEQTIHEIYAAVSPHAKVRFIVCEDGSSDGTEKVLAELAKSIPMKLTTSRTRKGYSRAVIDGIKSLEASYLLCLDSDGQCDPWEFEKFWTSRNSQDLAIGWRVKRSDSFGRRFLSRSFFLVYQAFYHVPVHDPSCPFVLAHKTVVQRLLPELGVMKEGFWWEFTARAYRHGFKIQEFPVNHRLRSAGQTQVYRLKRMPGIGYRHFLALFEILRQTRKSSS